MPKVTNVLAHNPIEFQSNKHLFSRFRHQSRPKHKKKNNNTVYENEHNKEKNTESIETHKELLHMSCIFFVISLCGVSFKKKKKISRRPGKTR